MDNYIDKFEECLDKVYEAIGESLYCETPTQEIEK